MNFNQALKELQTSINKPAFLVDRLVEWQDYQVSVIEAKNLFQRLSGIINHANKDYNYLLKVIWDTASCNPVGDKLNYIDAIICKKKAQNNRYDISKQPKYKSIQEVLDQEEKIYGSR